MALLMRFILVPFNYRCLIRYYVADRLAIPFTEEMLTRVHPQLLATVFLDFIPSPIVVYRLAEDPDTVPHVSIHPLV